MYKIKTFYFPVFIVYVVSPVALIFSIYLMINGTWWGVLPGVLAILCGTTHYVTAVDKDKKEYMDYLWVLGLKLNAEAGRFSGLLHILILKEEHSYKAATRSSDRSVRFSDYSATLVFVDSRTLTLLTDTDKHRLLLSIKGMANYLSVEVEDRTVRDPYVIDMSAVI